MPFFQSHISPRLSTGIRRLAIVELLVVVRRGGLPIGMNSRRMVLAFIAAP
uniref:Uncharacterized protein n=1 Tax=Mycetohabitans sp. TaxID=2571162 RepID=A0A6B9HF84_9BURK|nr:hypothetical protein [Mycetohabitans sp.]